MKPTGNSGGNKLNITFDLRVVIAVLLLIIVGMAYTWKPWAATSSNSQTVQVSGEAKLTDEPDEFTFNPTYQFTDANKDKALAALSKKSDEVTAKLKALGVGGNKIKTNSDGYDYYPAVIDEESKDTTYTLQLTAAVSNKAIAQKVQDYLLTTAPTGAVSPQATFSDAKRKELESKARDEATKDARKKADQMAKNLGFKVGKIKSVSDSAGFGVTPLENRGSAAMDIKVESGLTLQPGENDLNYSVTVVYFIR